MGLWVLSDYILDLIPRESCRTHPHICRFDYALLTTACKQHRNKHNISIHYRVNLINRQPFPTRIANGKYVKYPNIQPHIYVSEEHRRYHTWPDCWQSRKKDSALTHKQHVTENNFPF